MALVWFNCISFMKSLKNSVWTGPRSGSQHSCSPGFTAVRLGFPREVTPRKAVS